MARIGRRLARMGCQLARIGHRFARIGRRLAWIGRRLEENHKSLFIHHDLASLVYVSSFPCYRFRGGLVFKAQRLMYHSTPGSRVIKKKKNQRHQRNCTTALVSLIFVLALCSLEPLTQRRGRLPREIRPLLSTTPARQSAETSINDNIAVVQLHISIGTLPSLVYVRSVRRCR